MTKRQFPDAAEVLDAWNVFLVEKESPILVADRLRFCANQKAPKAIGEVAATFERNGHPIGEIGRHEMFQMVSGLVEQAETFELTVGLSRNIAWWAIYELAAQYAEWKQRQLAPLFYFVEGNKKAVDLKTAEGVEYLLRHFCALAKDSFPDVPNSEYVPFFKEFLWEHCGIPRPTLRKMFRGLKVTE